MIRRIKINGFRGLNVDFKLEPATVLIGRSGTGKTVTGAFCIFQTAAVLLKHRVRRFQTYRFGNLA